MIDTDNLRTASLYINNQLLSRGLLKDGQSIDFANPYRGDHDGNAPTTMGRIISVVNDLILRRDRDAEQRESLSATMRTLRADNMKLTDDVSRLKEKNVEAQRKLDIAESSEASLKTQLKSAEASMRGLKDDMARHRALVAQARTSCATEVRRRDRQIDTLKKQLGEAGRARGSRGNPAVTTIAVAGEFSAPARGSSGATSGSLGTGASAAAEEEYNLRDETNAFLADLARNLSQENEAIIATMRQTMEQLRQMSGWTGENDNKDSADPHVVRHLSWEDMSSDLSSVLSHMKLILTNPSFVPIEEVVIRDEEIVRLKDGWVKMEDRWKEAVHLMDGWRQRMAASGRPVDDEELKMGLRLSPIRVQSAYETRQAQVFDLSAVAEEEEENEHEEGGREAYQEMQVQEDDDDMVDSNHLSPCPTREESLELVPAPTTAQRDVYEKPAQTGKYDEAGFYEDDDEEEEEEEENWQKEMETDAEDVPNVQILQESAGSWTRSQESSPLPEPPVLTPLRQSPSAGNRRLAISSKRTKAKPEDTRGVALDDQPPPPPPHRIKPLDQPLPRVTRQMERRRSPARTSLEEALLPREEEDDEDQSLHAPTAVPAHVPDEDEDELASGQVETPRKGLSRLPLPRNHEQAPAQSPLTMATIAAKLAASEREADAARVRAKLKAARGTTRGVKRPTPSSHVVLPSEKSPKLSRPNSTSACSAREVKQKDDDDELAQEGRDDVDPVKRDLLPSPGDAAQEIKVEKRKRDRRTSKVTSRRRSTLSPWELESLMSGNVQ